MEKHEESSFHYTYSAKEQEEVKKFVRSISPVKRMT